MTPSTGTTQGRMNGWIKEAIKRPEIRTAIQAFVGFFLLLAILSAPPIWESFSLPQALVSPIYGLVSFSVVLQANVGTALNWTIQRLLAAACAGVLGLCCMYITYAANDLSYEPSVTKAAVMTTLTSFLGFCIFMCGYRWSRFWVATIVSSITLPIVALSGYHLTYVEPLTMPYFLMNVALGVAMAALVSMFILPITAGRIIRSTTTTCLMRLGQGTKELMEILLEEENNNNNGADNDSEILQKMAAATESIEEEAGIEIFPRLEADPPYKPIQQQHEQQSQHQRLLNLTGFIESWANPVSAAIVKAKALLLPVATEVDIYNRPLIFPRYAYGCLLDLIRYYTSTLMTLVYLAQGEAPLRAAKTLRADVVPIAMKIEACFTTAAAIIEQSSINRSSRKGSSSSGMFNKESKDSATLYISGLDTLTELEDALHFLSTKHIDASSKNEINDDGPSTTKATTSTSTTPTTTPTTTRSNDVYTEGEIVMADTLIAIIFALGSRLRRLFFILPETLPHRDSQVWDAWRKHYNGQTWDFENEENRVESSRYMSWSLGTTPAGGGGTGGGTGGTGGNITKNGTIINSNGTISTGNGTSAAAGGGNISPPSLSLSLSKSPFYSLSLQREVSEARSPLTPGHLARLVSPRSLSIPLWSRELMSASLSLPLPSSLPSTRHPPLNSEGGGGGGVGEVGLVTSVVERENREDVELGGIGIDGKINKSAVQQQQQPPPRVSFFSSLKQRWNALPSLVDIDLPWGFTGEGFILSFQIGIALAIATVIHVCPASNDALNNNTIWIVVTVAVLAQKSVGGVGLRGLNRVLGTVAAGLLGLGVIYFVYLTNGLSYLNHVPKFIFMTLSLSLVSGFLMYGSVKAPIQYAYAWMVCKFTLPIITLVGYSGEEIQPKTTLWRLLNISIGLAIDLVVTSLVFPQSTKAAVERRVCKVLDDLAEICRATPSKLLHARSEGLNVNMSRASSLFKWQPSSLPSSSPQEQQRGQNEKEKNGQEKEKESERQEKVAEESVVEAAGGAATGGEVEMREVSPVPTMNLHIRTTTLTPTPPPTATASAINPQGAKYGKETPFLSTSPSFYVSSPTKQHSKNKFRKDRSRWLKQVALGKPVLKIRPLGQDAAALLVAISELEVVASFEEKMITSIWTNFLKKQFFNLFNTKKSRKTPSSPSFSPSSPPTTSEDTTRVVATDISTVRRHLRRMLNVLLSFVYVLDGPDVPHLKLLLQHRPNIDSVMLQISECLLALRGVASHKLPLTQVIATQTNLHEKMQGLILAIETVPPPRGCTQADVVLGFAGLGVLTAAVQNLSELSDSIVTLLVPYEEILAYYIAEDSTILPDGDTTSVGVPPGEQGSQGGQKKEQELRKNEAGELDSSGNTNNKDGLLSSSNSSSAASLGKNKSKAALRYAGANMPWASSAKVLLGGGGGGGGSSSAAVMRPEDDEDLEVGLAGGVFGQGG